MAKKKEVNFLDGLEGNILASIRLAKAEYETKPTNTMYSIITNLELILVELKKLK